MCLKFQIPVILEWYHFCCYVFRISSTCLVGLMFKNKSSILNPVCTSHHMLEEHRRNAHDNKSKMRKMRSPSPARSPAARPSGRPCLQAVFRVHPIDQSLVVLGHHFALQFQSWCQLAILLSEVDWQPDPLLHNLSSGRSM